MVEPPAKRARLEAPLLPSSALWRISAFSDMCEVGALASSSRGLAGPAGCGALRAAAAAQWDLIAASRVLDGAMHRPLATIVRRAADRCREAEAALRSRAAEGRPPLPQPSADPDFDAAFVLLGELITHRLERPCTSAPYVALARLRQLSSCAPAATPRALARLCSERARADATAFEDVRASFVVELGVLDCPEATVAAMRLLNSWGEPVPVRVAAVELAQSLASTGHIGGWEVALRASDDAAAVREAVVRAMGQERVTATLRFCLKERLHESRATRALERLNLNGIELADAAAAPGRPSLSEAILEVQQERRQEDRAIMELQRLTEAVFAPAASANMADPVPPSHRRAGGELFLLGDGFSSLRVPVGPSMAHAAARVPVLA